MIIDFHAHGVPAAFAALMEEKVGAKIRRQALWDERERLSALDRGKIDIEVLTFSPNQQFYSLPERVIDLARAINDGLADIRRAHPDRFAAFCTVPMNRPREAIPELERAVGELGLAGVSIPSNIGGATLDGEEFQEVFARIDELGLPVFIHPVDRDDFPRAWQFFRLDHYIGWPVDTAVCVCKMICSGMFDRLTRMTLIVAHLGGPIHGMLARIDRSRRDGRSKKAPVEYLKRFYYDTAGPSHGAAVMGAARTFGADHILFGTDLPWGQEGDYLERAFESVQESGLRPEEKELVFGGNAMKLIRRD